jgi:hypothetical protein
MGFGASRNVADRGYGRGPRDAFNPKKFVAVRSPERAFLSSGLASMHGSGQQAFVFRIERVVKLIARRRKFAAADGHVPRRLNANANSAASNRQDFDNDVVANQYLFTVLA